MSDKLFERVLLTNDDGIASEGILALERAANLVAGEVWIVAPESDSSGTAACINLHEPIRSKQLSDRQFFISGTPSDCILMACRFFMRDKPPTIILTGINSGANLADDVLFSGTTNAALVSVFLGIPAVAFSQAYHNSSNIPWSTAEALIPLVLKKIDACGWPRGVAFNVNFPDARPDQISGIEGSRQGRGSILAVEVEPRLDRRERPYYWLGFTRDQREQDIDTDISVLRRKAISVTPLKLDRTDHESLFQLRQYLDSGSELPKKTVEQ